MANDSGPVDFSSLGGTPTSAVTPTAAAAPPAASQPDTSSGPVNFSSLGGRPVTSDQSAAATVAQTIPPAATPISGVHTPGTPWPKQQPWYVRAANTVGETGAEAAQFGEKLAQGDTDAWTKFKSRMFEPVKQEEIERIPGLEPDRAFSLQEHGQDFLGHVFGKDRGDYIRENILNGFTPEVVARGAAKSLTDWYSPVMLAASVPGRIAHGYAVAAEAAQNMGQAERATELLGKAKLAGVIGTVSGVPFVGSQVNSLIDNWQGMTPAERVAALSGILGGSMMTGVAVREAGGPKEVGKAVVDPIKQLVQDRAAAKVNRVSGEDMIAANQDFKKAVPPTKTNPYTDNDLITANNYLEPQHIVEPIRSTQHVVDALDHSVEGIENKVSDHVKIIPNEPIATNVLDDVESALRQNERGDEFVKAGMKEIEGLDLLDMNMARADSVRRQLNAENQAILKKNNYDLAAARAGDPGFAAREAAAESLRNGIYNQLEAHGIEGVRELRQEEGSLLKVRNAAQAQIFNGDKTLKGTGGGGTARRLLGRGAQAAGTALGAGTGAAVAGVPGAIVGGGVGAEVGSMVKDAIVPPDLTRDETLERRFNNYKAATGQPTEPTVNLHAPAPEEVPVGTQGSFAPPVPPATPGIPEQPNLFGTTSTQPSQQSPMVERQLLQQKIRPLQAILESPIATAAEKIEAARQIAKLGLGQFANPEVPQANASPGEVAGAAKASVNPTEATGERAPGSKTVLETAQPSEAGEPIAKPVEQTGQTDHAEGYVHPDTLQEPAREIPAGARPTGTTSQQVHEHEMGGHLANAAVEGFSADHIIGNDHPAVGRRTIAATVLNWDGIDVGPDGKLTVQSVRDNIHKILSVTMGGGVQDSLNGLPFDKNKGLSGDIRFARDIAKYAGFSPEETTELMKAAVERAKKNLTQSGMQDTIKSNAAVREPNLAPDLHASPERTRGLVNEFRRIHEQNGNTIGQAHGEGEAVQGNVAGTAAEGPGNRPVDDAGREGGTARPAEKQPLKTTGLREASTGDAKVDEAIKSAGAIPAGRYFPGEDYEIKAFHDPETGTTLGFKAGEAVTADAVRQKLAESREKFGVKVGMATEKEEEPTDVKLKDAANAFNEAHGRGDISPAVVGEDPRSSDVADSYKAAVHSPNDPAVKKSYDALKRDVAEQFELAKKMGIKMDVSPENPYGLSEDTPAHGDLHNDVLNNKHLTVWSGGAPPADHPLSEVDPKTGFTYNEMFRMVHDIFGHAVEKNDFSPAGEESAWNLHRQMFSPEARPALATETKGQAAYIYKYGDFPPQKAAILPAEHQVRPEDLSSAWSQKAAADAKAQGGGFTIDPRTGKAPESGYTVEARPESRVVLDHDATPQDIQKFHDDNKQLFDEHPELHIGGYKKELNVSANVESRQAAENLAKKLDQVSIWDVKKGEEILTGGTGKQTEFPDYSFQNRVDDLREPDKPDVLRRGLIEEGEELNFGKKSLLETRAAREPAPVPIKTGNIDVNHRPIHWGPSGNPSTIYSATVAVDQKGNLWKGKYKSAPAYALVPTLANGKFLILGDTGDPKKKQDPNKFYSPDGKEVSLEDAAARQYEKTHQHLGIFKSAEDADRYAEATHAWMPNGRDEKIYNPFYEGESNMPLTQREYDRELSRQRSTGARILGGRNE